jgi:hypothetical protein
LSVSHEYSHALIRPWIPGQARNDNPVILNILVPFLGFLSGVEDEGLEPSRVISSMDFESTASTQIFLFNFGDFLKYFSVMVPKEGLEPSRVISSMDFESTASTNSATSAQTTYRILPARGAMSIEYS